MSDIARIPFGRAPDGRMIAIDEVMRGLACECACPECRSALVACKGEMRRHYFRHHVELNRCQYPRETAIHLFAKQVICETLECRLPDIDLGPIKSAKAEVSVGTIRPDVLAEYIVEPVAIEIWVAHRVPQEKIDVFDRHKLAAVEIDLRPYRFADLSEGDWRNAVISEADRTWLYPPKEIRAENARRRRQELAEMRAKERELEAAFKQAEEEHRLHEDALRRFLETQAAEALKREQMRREQAEQRQQYEELLAAFDRWRAQMLAPPDLTKLIEAHRGYDQITPEAWAQFDADMRRFRKAMAEGLRYLPTRELRKMRGINLDAA